ncbi:TPA: hypothetical protein ACVPFL_002215 [Morganella morganii]
MLPPVSINTDTSAHISHHNYQAAPLTPERVTRNSCLTQKDQCSSRSMGHLSWVEYEHVASLHDRIDFINKVTSYIADTIPLQDTPITLISLGSGGLLTESFIDEQLKNSGYKDLNWRVIDPNYQNNGYAQCRKEFKQRVNNNIRAFTTEQAYLNKSLGHYGLAENDKNHGATVILSIFPPTALAEISYDPDCMVLKGRSVEDVSKANGIYLFVVPPDYKEMLDKVPHVLSEEDQLIVLDCALKCSINKQGNYEINVSPSENGRFINNGTKPYLDSLSKMSNLTQKKIELSHVDKAFDKYIEELNNSDRIGMKFFVSDYDISIVKLHDYFIDSNNKTLFASFDKNETSFKMNE